MTGKEHSSGVELSVTEKEQAAELWPVRALRLTDVVVLQFRVLLLCPRSSEGPRATFPALISFFSCKLDLAALISRGSLKSPELCLFSDIFI